MALVIPKTELIRDCWGCDLPIVPSEPAIVICGSKNLCLHTGCALTIGRQILRDVASLHDLGYKDFGMSGD